MRITRYLFVFALLLPFGAGCGERPIAQGSLPPSVPNTTYRVTVHRAYDATEPAALLTFERDHAGNPTHGTIVGKIHGWPFPYADLSGDSGEGLFSYRTDFTVTRVAKDRRPAVAEGVRTVYFHPDRAPVSLNQPASLALGRPVIRDSVKLRFTFESQATVEIAETSKQIWMSGFDWNGLLVTPPGQPTRTKVLTASYSPRYDGYVLR